MAAECRVIVPMLRAQGFAAGAAHGHREPRRSCWWRSVVSPRPVGIVIVKLFAAGAAHRRASLSVRSHFYLLEDPNAVLADFELDAFLQEVSHLGEADMLFP
jgi:hypothetical protein